MTYKYICHYLLPTIGGASEAHGEGKGMNRALLAATLVMTLLAACGEGGGPRQRAEAAPDTGTDTLRIEVVDTLGVMMGDSAYVFGNITEAEVAPDGRIYVLDGLLTRVCVYSRHGEFLESAGRRGSGPGEFLYPRSMALYHDGSMVISDWPGATITYLKPDLAFDTLLSGFGQLSPHAVDPLPDGGYIGGDLEYRMGDDGPEGDLYVARYGRGVEPEKILWRWPLTIVTEEHGGERDVYVYNAETVRDTGPDGTVYMAISSDTTWSFAGFTPDGDTVLSVEREWEPVPKTAGELEEGEYSESLSWSDEGGSSISRGRRTEGISPWRTAISSLDVDHMGRIWVGQGWTDAPTFEVYSPQGELLFVASVPGLEDTEGIQYAVGEGGMVGYDTEPMDYPKVYLLRPEETL